MNSAIRLSNRLKLLSKTRRKSRQIKNLLENFKNRSSRV